MKNIQETSRFGNPPKKSRRGWFDSNTYRSIRQPGYVCLTGEPLPLVVNHQQHEGEPLAPSSSEAASALLAPPFLKGGGGYLDKEFESK